MRILNLTLKKKWFDMILSGEKKEEYREIKLYWVTRLINFKDETEYDIFNEFCNDLKDNQFRYANMNDLLESFNCEFKKFDAIKFTNGYAKNAPSFLIKCNGIDVHEAVPEWSDNWQGNVFILKLGEIMQP